VRVDSACYPGYVIPPNYDSMIGKLIVRGKDRNDAIKIAERALREFHIGGVHSTIPFHLYMLSNGPFLDLKYDLTYIDKLINEGVSFKIG
jgi:acetyl-CoA carboxylase biotin carboxylase subunit